jgi:ankyrin repeat protein
MSKSYYKNRPMNQTQGKEQLWRQADAHTRQGEHLRGMSELQYACETLDLPRIKRLLEEGADPDESGNDYLGRTPAMIALDSIWFREDAPKKLHGSLTVNDFDAPPLSFQVLSLLHKHGANMDAVDNNGQSISHRVAIYTKCALPIDGRLSDAQRNAELARLDVVHLQQYTSLGVVFDAKTVKDIIDDRVTGTDGDDTQCNTRAVFRASAFVASEDARRLIEYANRNGAPEAIRAIEKGQEIGAQMMKDSQNNPITFPDYI